ncbi:serine/threonine-protein kinase [Streptomyces sp. NPDC004111]|uniref:serine/threonine-protein kinase n=1 Tax=Streptomyces sp. NPDC004111 TaxID=3364690 RepID=UPI00367DFEA0
MQPLEAGEPQNIGDYRLLGRLGSGGMGRVYLGRSAGGRTVAVKIVHPHFALDEEFRARFRREVEAARRVGGAWTAPVLDADPDAAVPWVATGYVAGPSLTQALAAHGPLPDHSVRVLGAGLAEALTAVHALGLVHRDVKPSNVLLTLDGPRLIDFGIARATDGTASLTSTGVSIGSPGYMSPEQILGKGVGPAADVFSLGAVLSYAATGAAPFPGDSAASLLYKVVHEEPELDGLEGDLRDLVTSCLAKTAADRPTPPELAARLAPDGAAAAVAAGWLPAALVADAGRGAVRLLDLEAGGAAGAAAAEVAPSGPVPFTHGVERNGAAAAPAGQFGPAPAGYGTPAAGEGSGAGASDAAASGGGGSGVGGSGGSGVGGVGAVPPAPPSGPPSATGGPGAPGRPGAAPAPSGHGPVPPGDNSAPPGHGPVPPGGKSAPSGRPGISVSVATETALPQGPGSTGRRRSCTLVLAVAGVLAVGTLGATFLTGLWGNGGADGAGEQEPGARGRPPAASSPATPGPTPPKDFPSGAPVAAVPDAFLGSWSGPLTEGTTGMPHGSITLTVTKGGKGQDVVRTDYDAYGAKCYGIGKLVSATTDELRLIDRTDPDRPSTPLICAGGSSELILTRAPDGTLRYSSPSEKQGKPYGTLTKR